MANNLFQGMTNQMNTPDYYNPNKNNMNLNWTPQNNIPNYWYRPPITTPVTAPVITSTIPGRVIFSPEQISPQEIPSNGNPAVFPMSDGSRIIVKALTPNGTFDEQVYVLEENKAQNLTEPEESEFDLVMKRLNSIESSLKSVLDDLYGTKKEAE